MRRADLVQTQPNPSRECRGHDFRHGFWEISSAVYHPPERRSGLLFSVSRHFDVVVAGAGIIGAACAASLSDQGRRVAIVDPAGMAGPGGRTTSTSMGHILTAPERPELLALSAYGRRVWRDFAPQLAPTVGYRVIGTLWLAETRAELDKAAELVANCRAAGVEASVVDARWLAVNEPRVAGDLVGGVVVPGDAAIDPGEGARYFWSRIRRSGGEVLAGTVSGMGSGEVRLADHRVLTAPVLVNAAGVGAATIDPWSGVVPRKGHLVQVNAGSAWCRHEVVEVSYLAAVSNRADAATCNIQPRAGGRLVLGASRQYGSADESLDHSMIARMLQRCERFLPGSSGLQVERAWAGLRPTTADGLPLIGRVPGDDTRFIATGHEGLGITAAMATGRIIAGLVSGHAPDIPIDVYDPARLLVAGPR